MSQLDSMSQEVPSTGMEKFLEANFRKLVWLFVAAVLAIVAYGFIHHQRTAAANEAAEAFTAAKTVEDCDLVISRHPGSNAAANALLLKADLLWKQNKKSSAFEALKEFTTKHARHPLFVHTLLGLGTKLDAMGDRKEAQAIFERITREFPSSEAAPLAQLRLGDLLWADGKQEEARKAYEELAVKFPDMQEFQSLSQNRLGWITASLPTKEVDPPPAPKVEAKPASGTPVVPGLPKLNLTPGAGGLGATIAPPGTPAAPAMLTPAAPAPTAAPAPAPTAPQPATPVPAPVAAPAASAPSTPPAAAAPPAPAAPASPTPPSPAAPKP